MSECTGVLLLVSGPSGSGKTTLCRSLAEEGEAHYATSCTTRPIREGEKNGHDYHFLTVEQFQNYIEDEKFLEYAEVHGNYYGTLKSEVIKHLQAGKDVVMDLDIQGAQQVRSSTDLLIKKALVDLFVTPADELELRRRLNSRGTDDSATIALRLKNALEEISHWQEYTYRLLSRSKEHDYKHFKSLLYAERLRTLRCI